MMEELNAALESLEYQRDVKLVVLAAAGKYFSAGFELADHLGDRAYMMLEEFQRIFENLAKLDKPTLAVVGGPALGAGCILAAACDIVLAAASAKFGHPEIKGGVFNPVAAALLPRLVGPQEGLRDDPAAARCADRGRGRADRPHHAAPCPTTSWRRRRRPLIQRFQEGSAPVLQLARRAIAGGLDLPSWPTPCATPRTST